MKALGLQTLAKQDILDAIDYYLSQAGTAIAERFVDALDRTMDALQRRPGAGSLAFADALDINDLRFMALKAFPYAIFYQEPGTEINVLRVLHHGRDVMSLIGAAA